MTDMRAQLAVALGSSGHVQDKLDAVMALVGQIERERDEARASVEHLRGDYRRIRKDRDRLLLAWRSARRRANAWRAAATTEIPRWDADAVVRRFGFLQPDQCGKCGEVNPRLTEALWLHAEAVWQRNEARERADKRLVKYVAVADELDAQKALRASAVQLPESWVGNLWNALATRIDDLDNLNDAYEAIKHVVESWRPATVEAAPPTPAEPFGVRLMREGMERSQAEAELPRDPWRLAEWNALPDVCLIDGCQSIDADQRGPIFLRDGSIHKACSDHWEAIVGILGQQAGSTDAAPWSAAGVSGTGTEASDV